FSNPTDRAEAQPEDILNWTEGRALVATGSPFAPVRIGTREYGIGQGNNVFIFPGLGLGALASNAQSVTDSMVSAASAALARAITDEELARGLLFPAIDRLREVCRDVAVAVVRQAEADGVDRRQGADIDDMMWTPDYPEYTLDD
ncbi:MAG: NAD-dependent malic enzyme, partial [Gammaproteobacteria bacterium]|nr:NAD-dependent malic enzyme [Gammaproteobacteria bacterium]